VVTVRGGEQMELSPDDDLLPPLVHLTRRHLPALTRPFPTTQDHRSCRRRRYPGGAASIECREEQLQPRRMPQSPRLEALGPPPPAGAPPSTAASLGKPSAAHSFFLRPPRACMARRGRRRAQRPSNPRPQVAWPKGHIGHATAWPTPGPLSLFVFFLFSFPSSTWNSLLGRPTFQIPRGPQFPAHFVLV
jgi:hypothetical protein